MQFEIGKIHDYDNYSGKIVSSSGVYMFLHHDIKNEDIKEGDIVIFRPEKINNENRAFSIKKLENILVNTKERKKILKK